MNPHFNGQLMRCIFCGDQQVAEPDRESNWRCIETDGWPFYCCPKEFPQDNANSERFKKAYRKAIAKTQELLRDRKCRVCGCSECAACDGGCFWVEWDLCSECGEHADSVQIQLNIGQGMCVVAALQLASRHPNFVGPTRDTAEAFARFLQKAISRSPVMAQILEAGWHPEFDQPAESRIVIPAGCGVLKGRPQ
jgi:hypothetical protein